MMGGDKDASSKGVFGACKVEEQEMLLIVDPHFVGEANKSTDTLVRDGWVKWVPLEDFDQNSFYNLCLPQIKL